MTGHQMRASSQAERARDDTWARLARRASAARLAAAGSEEGWGEHTPGTQVWGARTWAMCTCGWRSRISWRTHLDLHHSALHEACHHALHAGNTALPVVIPAVGYAARFLAPGEVTSAVELARAAHPVGRLRAAAQAYGDGQSAEILRLVST
ncbi:hypothetical protein D3C74_251960 [compost metagenome]